MTAVGKLLQRHLSIRPVHHFNYYPHVQCRLRFSQAQIVTESERCRALLQRRSLIKPSNGLVKPVYFHTTPRANIPPVIWLVVKPVAKLISILSGRSFRNWWKTLPEEKKLEWRKKVTWRHLVALAGAFCGALSLYYITHLEEVPIVKRKRFVAFTESQFSKIMKYEAELMLEQVKNELVPSEDPIYKTIASVVNQIVQKNQDLDFFRKQTWSIAVVNSEAQNAFVLPTGDIFVFTGLLKTFDNVDQLAVVMGHEMAHALLRHGKEQLSVAQILDFVIIVTMAALWAVVPSDGLAVVTSWFYHKVIDVLLHLPYSRKLEAEADEVGLMLVAKACFDVRQSSAFWQLMALHSNLPAESSKVIEFLSTHPAHESRAENLDAIMQSAIELRTACNCPKLPQADPRLIVQDLRHRMQQEQLKPVTMPVRISPPQPKDIILGRRVDAVKSVSNQTIAASPTSQSTSTASPTSNNSTSTHTSQTSSTTPASSSTAAPPEATLSLAELAKVSVSSQE